MKKTAQDFGSHWNRTASRVRTEESAETTCDSEDDYLGFRLAHDSEERVNRGECWFDRAGTAHSALGVRNHPSEKYSNTGLRLCVGWNQK